MEPKNGGGWKMIFLSRGEFWKFHVKLHRCRRCGNYIQMVKHGKFTLLKTHIPFQGTFEDDFHVLSGGIC